jgi:hypothetical protein
VSDDGRVRVLPAPGRGRLNQVRVMKLQKVRRYWSVVFGGTTHRVHSLMLEAFVGPRPPGLLGLHDDDNPDNNTLPNLRWGTCSQNNLDMVANGNHNCARKTHCKWGHPFEGDNLILRRGWRVCRACAWRRDAEYKARAS